MAQTEQNPMGPGIKIVYKYIDGAHFFSSYDEGVEGLCVASEDLLTAFNEVSTQLNLLYKHNLGIDTNFRPALPFDVFKSFVESAIDNAENYVNQGLIVPSSIQPWTFGGTEFA